jgi:crossover junction endodeoxyribonuclease RuvC
VPELLNYIFQEMTKILNKFMPNSLAIEDAFYSNNVKSAMVLGQARGAVILSGAQAKLPIYEFAPRKVKMSVCGNGAATKEQVAFMVSRILQLSEQPKPLDVTDAMAVGICFFNQEKLF